MPVPLETRLVQDVEWLVLSIVATAAPVWLDGLKGLIFID